MRSYLSSKKSKVWRIVSFIVQTTVLVVLAIIIDRCTVSILSVDQPATATVGDVVPIVLHVSEIGGVTRLGDPFQARYVCAILAPKGWNAAANTTITYTSNKGNGVMRLIGNDVLEPTQAANGLNWPASLKAKFGTGGNLIDDVEWVAFQSDDQYSFANGDLINGDISIKLKVGADNNNTSVKLGYMVCESTDGISPGVGTIGLEYGTYFGSCFIVTGGTTGDLVDFCNPQLTTVSPPKASDNDLLTFTIDENVSPTALSGNEDIYLCATAAVTDTVSGAVTTTEVCDQTAKTKMTELSQNRFGITIWPRTYFNLKDTQTITRITYFITDKTGTVQVGYNNTTAPFSFKFKCG